MQQSLKYQATDSGNVDVLDVYTTDGRLALYDFVVLQDDRHFFPPYEAAALARGETLIDHLVQPGDSYWSLSQRYGTSAVRIMQANGRLSSELLSGEVIQVPTRLTVANTLSDYEYVIHVVESGDTLWDLAIAYDTALGLITAANCLSPTTTLHLGDELRIPSPEADEIGAEALRSACP